MHTARDVYNYIYILVRRFPNRVSHPLFPLFVLYHLFSSRTSSGHRSSSSGSMRSFRLSASSPTRYEREERRRKRDKTGESGTSCIAVRLQCIWQCVFVCGSEKPNMIRITNTEHTLTLLVPTRPNSTLLVFTRLYVSSSLLFSPLLSSPLLLALPRPTFT